MNMVQWLVPDHYRSQNKTYPNSLNHVWPIAKSFPLIHAVHHNASNFRMGHCGQVASFTTVELICTMPLELVSVFKTHSTQPQVPRCCQTRVEHWDCRANIFGTSICRAYFCSNSPPQIGAAIWWAPSHAGSTSTVARSHRLRWCTEAQSPKLCRWWLPFLGSASEHWATIAVQKPTQRQYFT